MFQIFPDFPSPTYFEIPLSFPPVFFHIFPFRGLGVGAAEGRGPGDRAAADLGLRGTGERADGRTRPPRGSGKGWMEGGLASGNFT